MSASSTILPYRTRSRMIVSYDEDFGKVDWADFIRSTAVEVSVPDHFAKVDWETIFLPDDFAKVDWDKEEKKFDLKSPVSPVSPVSPTFDLKFDENDFKPINWVPFTTSVGDRLYRIKAKSSKLLYPFVFHGAEIVGYTTDLVTVNADFKKEWHPLMEEVVKLNGRLCIDSSLRTDKKWDIPNDGEVHLWVHNGVTYAADAYRCVWSITADEDLEWVGIYNLETGVIDAVPEPIYCD